MIQKNPWKNLPKNFTILAPMEAVTDVIFREVIRTASAPEIFFTEFTNATGWVAAGEKAIGGRLIKQDQEFPLIAQLWGADPAAMKKLAMHCKELGYDGIDLNTGCPDSSATKSGGGSALIKNPTITRQLVEAAKESGLPVSVKTRLGYSSLEERHEWISFLLGLDLAALTIHLRTKKEMSKVDAHWELMPEIVSLRDALSPDTLIIGNGDVRDRSHGEEVCDTFGCDGVMIGRGVFANPFCFEKKVSSHSREELLDLLKLQLDLYDTFSDRTGRPFDTLKRFFKIYVRDFEGAGELRNQLMIYAKNTADVRTLLQ